ncbi:DUF803-domain-containing protein [Polyplosphaeria fusca]|uniref:DUF803-domain-containing protein n=1 Tax=Polyplosphaeria fusca TaxID=682080 RepID=A0A9P4QLT9_9PLEO|nr:DUF803-domain-containing protein [Polyplosphaeria fusca]
MDSASDALLVAHDLYARSGAGGGDTSKRPPIYKLVGIVLAIASGLFIGVSFVLKKLGLLKANVKYNEEAGEGYGYLKNAWWWSGMTLMIVGEICNFVAYAFVDAILVTPMGALSVVVTAILSAIFLKERLSFVGKVGCFNCIIGSVVIVINAPAQSAVATIQDMQHLVIQPGFLSYAGVVIVGCVIIALWLGPKYGKKSMMVYLTVCSLIGGLSVVATQGLGAAVIAQIDGKPQFNQWFLYVLLVFVIATLLTEIIYLNKALNLFNAALVTPTYYVFFTSSTIVTSAILFQGFKGTASTISTVIMGFLQICAGVVLLQLSKSAKDVPDAAVFKGDLDQVRTVAEQEEPEYEPRADTIRGGGAILRSLSRARTEKQVKEVKRLQEEQMEPIGENEQVEWDGLRRRRTVLDPGRSATVIRHKPVHPPLGMSQFPQADDSDNDSEMHPGFFTRLRTRSRGKSTGSRTTAGAPAMDLETLPSGSTQRADSGSNKSEYKSPSLQEDTAYNPHGSTHVQFIATPHPHRDDHESSRDSLHPPKPPPHTAKRQFSFQNVFGRNRSESNTSAASARPTSRGSRKGSKENANATEEERLGLVKGDSSTLLPIPSRSSQERDPGPPGYADDDWANSPSRAQQEQQPSLRRIDTEEGEFTYSEKDDEKGGGKPGAFL